MLFTNMWKHCLNVRPAVPASPALVFKWMLCRMLSRPRYAWAMVDVLCKVRLRVQRDGAQLG